jgi:glyoxylase-like metal-dependent hydrolase (beta-lactamase superfamily II)
MPVCKISDRCLQIKRFNVMNCYLVSESDGLTLIDTAMGAARIIVEAARYLGHPIRRTLLTHAHLDHVGSLDMLKKLVPDMQVMIGSRESLLLGEAARGVRPSKMALLPGEPQTPVKGSFKKVKSLPDRLLEENDLIGSLRVILTPGHTPGHLSFLDERDRSIYAGDALTTFQEVRLPFDPPWYFPFAKPGTWHFPSALASARGLAALEPSRILAGHGPAVENARLAVQHAILRAGEQIKA